MTRICWWLVDILSGALALDERDAVRGDFTESGETGGQALRDLLGLVVRRQAALWSDWRPWLALIGLVIPVGVLLSISSSWLDRSYDLYLWIIRNYRDIDPAILSDIGLTVRHGIVLLVSRSLLLVSWSWASGFVLGSLSRRAVFANGAMFCLVVFSGELLSTPMSRVFSLTLSAWLPLVLMAVLVLLPSLWGMYQGFRRVRRPLIQTVLWAAAIVTALATRSWFWWPLQIGYYTDVPWARRLTQILLLAVYWPMVYVLATANWRRWHHVLKESIT